MAQVLRRRGRIQVRLNANEREALLSIVDRLAPRINAPLSAGRVAYDDATYQAEYDRWVRPEVERGREADLSAVGAGLKAAAGNPTVAAAVSPDGLTLTLKPIYATPPAATDRNVAIQYDSGPPAGVTASFNPAQGPLPLFLTPWLAWKPTSPVAAS